MMLAQPKFFNVDLGHLGGIKGGRLAGWLRGSLRPLSQVASPPQLVEIWARVSCNTPRLVSSLRLSRAFAVERPSGTCFR